MLALRNTCSWEFRLKQPKTYLSRLMATLQELLQDPPSTMPTSLKLLYHNFCPVPMSFKPLKNCLKNHIS